jgi:hypothetical protein
LASGSDRDFNRLQAAPPTWTETRIEPLGNVCSVTA